MGTHLRVLSESYPMSTNMTGFEWFSKIFTFLYFGRLQFTCLEAYQHVQTKQKLRKYFLNTLVLHLNILILANVVSLSGEMCWNVMKDFCSRSWQS